MIQWGQLGCCWALERETFGFKFEFLAVVRRFRAPSLLGERVVVGIKIAITELHTWQLL